LSVLLSGVILHKSLMESSYGKREQTQRVFPGWQYYRSSCESGSI